MRIAFSGKARSGKDTAAEIIATKLLGKGEAVRMVRFAEPLYDMTTYIQKCCGKPVVKDPGLLQFVGQGLRRHYGDNIFVDIAYDRIIQYRPPTAHIICTDLRYKTELAMLRRMGFTIVRIVRDNRPIDRDPLHPSEVDLDDVIFDIVIENNGTLAEYEEKICELIA